MAFATFISRILGLVREMLTARIIGGGTIMTAWGLAFTAANIFRRLFGEGAAGTAIVPIITHTLAQNGRIATRQKLAILLSSLSCLLAITCIITGTASYILSRYITIERWQLAFCIIPIIISYALFICLTGAITSVLNSIGRFFLPALLSLLLNISLITCLLLICPKLTSSPFKLLTALSLAVVISGIIQFFLMLYVLAKNNLFPIFAGTLANLKPTLAELWHLTLPGLVGASALQLSLIIDRSLACIISQYAVPSLIFSDRIVYLPIGIFAVSIGSVALASLSRSAATGDTAAMFSSLSFCLRLLLFICIPAAAFVLTYKVQLIELFYFGGKFGPREVQETALALQYYALGIPAFAAIKVTVSMFYSRKEMKIPVRISICCIILNIILNLILMWPLKQGGLALATVISSCCNNILLLIMLKKEFPAFKLNLLQPIIKSGLAALAASFISYSIVTYGFTFPIDSMLIRFIHLSITTLLFGISYLTLAIILKSGETKELYHLLYSRFKPSATMPASEKQ